MKISISLALILSALNLAYVSSSLAHTQHTPPLQPEHFASSADAVKLAKVYSLPDYQDAVNTRSTGESAISSRYNNKCRDYDLISSCPYPKIPEGVVRPSSNLSCYKRCVCPSEYKYNYSNCSPRGYILGGGNCDFYFRTCEPKACPPGSKTTCLLNEISIFTGSYSGNLRCVTCRRRTCDEGAYCAVGYICVGTGADAACVNDTCPNNTQKSCDSLNYTAKYISRTAAGTSCYQCVAKPCPSPALCVYGCASYDKSRTEMCGEICNACKSKTQKCRDLGYKEITDFPRPGAVKTDINGNPVKVTWNTIKNGLRELLGIRTAYAAAPCGSIVNGNMVGCAECYKCVNGKCVYDKNYCRDNLPMSCPEGYHRDPLGGGCIKDGFVDGDVGPGTGGIVVGPGISFADCDTGYQLATSICIPENPPTTSQKSDYYLFKITSTCTYDNNFIKGSYIRSSAYCVEKGYVLITDSFNQNRPRGSITKPYPHYDFVIDSRCPYHADYVKSSWQPAVSKN